MHLKQTFKSTGALASLDLLLSSYPQKKDEKFIMIPLQGRIDRQGLFPLLEAKWLQNKAIIRGLSSRLKG